MVFGRPPPPPQNSPLSHPQPPKPPAAALVVGNVLPLAQIPEGTVVSNVEARPGDRGTFSRTSGAYAVIVAQVCVGVLWWMDCGG